MNHQLIVTILGTDKSGILSEIAGAVSESQCNILDSRQAIYGKEFSLTMIIEGTHQAVTRAELTLPTLCQHLGLLSVLKRTSHHEKQNLSHLYDVSFSGEDSPGLLRTVTGFFADRHVSINAFRQSTDVDKCKNQTTVRCKFVVSVPDDIDFEQLKHELDTLYASLNLTGAVVDKYKGDI
ncbi:glycine cleavage system protein R [Aestuariibacter sp. A3R04]|uniref:glycine cleavage system protein R n=1 Tax=Aestuariibacter sp. A3R04 TaxID=2841571 RepID=UPI001C09C639|nr:ACT domain-containing protein [Aestuariibacter sp. A3R04]MBU3022800.1 ACT domain-containing protein [Aestuariibacter sp. A3R04]